MDKLKQRLASLISASISIAVLWALFKKINIIVLVHMKWWHFVLLLVAFFFFIDTVVAKGLKTKKPLERGRDRLSELGSTAKDGDATRSANDESEEILNDLRRRTKNTDR
jgi:hypothetical protein